MRIPIALAEQGLPARDVLVEVEPTTEVDDVAPALLALATRPPARPSLFLGPQPLAAAFRLLASGVVAGSVLGLGGPGPTADAPPEPGTLELAVVGGRTAGGATELRVGSLTIGRSPECDIVLHDTQASRLHARLTLAPDGSLSIEDLDSSNGTTINGTDLHGVAPLLLRDLVVIGSSALVVRPRDQVRAGLDPTGDGRLRYNKPPRTLPPGGQPAIAVPEEPRKPTGAHLPLGSMLAPLVLAPVLVLATGNLSLMLIVVVSPLMAGMNALFDSRSGRRTYKKRLAEYEEQSAAVGQRIKAALRDEERARRDSSPDPALVRTIATLPTGQLWERRPDDLDHLAVRIGLADQRAQVAVAGSVAGAPPLVARTVPVTVALHGRSVVGVAGGRPDVLALTRSMVLQAATLQSPNDLAFVVIADDGDAADWDWAKWLPHTMPRSHEPCQRLLGLNARQRARRLGELAATIQRREASSGLGAAAGDRDWPTTVVVFDRISRLRADEAVAYVLSAGPACGIVSLCLDDDPAGLPAESTVTVQFGTAASGDTILALAGAEIEPVSNVMPDGVSPAHATFVARSLAPLFEVAGRRQAAGVLPQPPVDHLDVLGLSPLSIDGVRRRWADQPRGPRALAPIGLDTAGPFEIDFVRDGPHALIAGTTGAGKSELLQVIVASLAATKGPDRLTFLLVDFKGGSAFKDCEQLPHTVGVISNLDGRLVARALDAIQAELRWREARFAEAGAKDFDEYESSSRSSVPIPRLVIVVDELKELADAYADAVPRLNQTARLGRGLGVHLLLATQKPASIHGLADLRANTDLRICLRVQDETDSRDLLGVPDAAHISRTTPGRGYARLSDGRLVAFQSGYLGDAADGGPTIAGTRNPVRSFAVAGVGDPVPADTDDDGQDGGERSSADAPTQLQALVGAIVEAGRQLELPVPRRPWLPPLPATISMDDARFAIPLPVGTFPIGLMDLPHQQLQQPLLFDFDQLAHVLVVGGTRSGRTSTLRTLAGMVAWRATPVDVHLYVVECRRRTMEDLERLPHCGAVVGIDDRDRLERLFAHLSSEIDRRSTIMGAAGSLHEQRSHALPGQALPHVLVLVDNYEAFYERFSYEDGGRFVEQFDMLVREGPARGIHFVVTTDQRAAFNRLSSVIDAQLVLRPTEQDAQLSLGLPSSTDLGEMPPGRGFWASGPVETQVSLLSPNPAGEAQVAAIVALAEQASRGIAPDDPRLPTHVNAMPVSLTTAEAAQRRRLARPNGAVTTFAVGGVAVEPIDVDLRAAGHSFVVAGPRSSGRSTALLSLTRSLLTEGTERVSAIVITPRRSPLRTLEGMPGVALLSDPATLTADLTEALAWMTGTVALVIDDAEQLLDNPVTMKFDQLVRAASDEDRLVVIGGTTADLMRKFSGWIFDARQSRSGLILQPGAPADGEVLDLRLARGTVGGDLPPGRGILTIRGRWMTAQVALPTDI